MSLLSIAAQNASLDNDYGSTAGPNAPASLEVALFDGDPLLGGLELTSDGGYARVTVANDGTTWPTAASGGAKTMATASFPTPTGAWSSTATFFVLYDAADSTTAWDSGELDDEIAVDADEFGVPLTTSVGIQPTVYYENLGA